MDAYKEEDDEANFPSGKIRAEFSRLNQALNGGMNKQKALSDEEKKAKLIKFQADKANFISALEKAGSLEERKQIIYAYLMTLCAYAAELGEDISVLLNEVERFQFGEAATQLISDIRDGTIPLAPLSEDLQNDLIKGEEARKDLRKAIEEVGQATDHFKKALKPAYEKALRGEKASEDELKQVVKTGNELKAKKAKHRLAHQTLENLCIENDKKIEGLESKEVKLKNDKGRKQKELVPLQNRLQQAQSTPSESNKVPEYQSTVSAKTAEIANIDRDLSGVQAEKIMRINEQERHLSALEKSKQADGQNKVELASELKQVQKVAEVNPSTKMNTLATDLKKEIEEPLADPGKQTHIEEIKNKHEKRKANYHKFARTKDPINTTIIDKTTYPPASIPTPTTPAAPSREGKGKGGKEM